LSALQGEHISDKKNVQNTSSVLKQITARYVYIVTLQCKTLQALHHVVHAHICRCMHQNNSCWNLVASSEIPIYVRAWAHQCRSVTFVGPHRKKQPTVITSRVRCH